MKNLILPATAAFMCLLSFATWSCKDKPIEVPSQIVHTSTAFNINGVDSLAYRHVRGPDVQSSGKLFNPANLLPIPMDDRDMLRLIKLSTTTNTDEITIEMVDGSELVAEFEFNFAHMDPDACENLDEPVPFSGRVLYYPARQDNSGITVFDIIDNQNSDTTDSDGWFEIQLQRDPNDLCRVAYGIRYGSTTPPNQIEMHFLNIRDLSEVTIIINDRVKDNVVRSFSPGVNTNPNVNTQ